MSDKEENLLQKLANKRRPYPERPKDFKLSPKKPDNPLDKFRIKPPKDR